MGTGASKDLPTPKADIVNLDKSQTGILNVNTEMVVILGGGITAMIIICLCVGILCYCMGKRRYCSHRAAIVEKEEQKAKKLVDERNERNSETDAREGWMKEAIINMLPPLAPRPGYYPMERMAVRPLSVPLAAPWNPEGRGGQ